MATLVAIIGPEPIKNPYTIHKTVLKILSKNINKEMSLVDFVCQVFTAWGKKESAVKPPATKPSMAIGSNYLSLWVSFTASAKSTRPS
jgi:hypothetical protein